MNRSAFQSIIPLPPILRSIRLGKPKVTPNCRPGPSDSGALRLSALFLVTTLSQGLLSCSCTLTSSSSLMGGRSV